MDDPRITVIVTVKNGQKTIAGCLDSILACDYKNREIIIVDDCSCDKTPEILMSYSPRVKVITNEKNRGPAASRNIAVVASTGEYLAFTDSDCLAEKYWLKELVSCFDDPAIAGAGGYQGIPGDETVSGRNISLFLNSIGFAAEYLRGSLSGPVVTSHNPSCNVLYKKEIFLEVEGFSQDLWTSEDVDLDYRLIKRGYKLMFNPRAIVYHYRQGGLKDFSGKMLRYGLAQGDRKSVV
jgi:glycosyltransferase involved in cell wall biosynthesis